MTDTPEFEVDCVVRKVEPAVVAFEVGDTVSFEYTDVSSKSRIESRGEVVGNWNGHPVVCEDGWTRTAHGTYRRLLRLDPPSGEVRTTRSENVGAHPDGDEKLAWSTRVRASNDEPQTRGDEWDMTWKRRGRGLTAFEFGVELDNPDPPAVRPTGVTVTAAHDR